MSAISKYLFYLNLFLLMLGVVYSFNVCNVDLDEPWFKVNDSSGKDILIVDNQGDIYLEGNDHTLNNVNSVESFQVGTSFFNSITSKFNLLNQKLTILPNVNGLVIKGSDFANKTIITTQGDIYTKGLGVYNNSQAGCLADGSLL